MSDPVAEVIEQVIDALPMERRLYPDIYSTDVANALREKGLIRE